MKTQHPTQQLDVKSTLQSIIGFMTLSRSKIKDFIETMIRRAQASAVKLPPNSRLTNLPEFTRIQEFFKGQASKLRAEFLPTLEKYLNAFEQAKQALFNGNLPHAKYKAELATISNNLNTSIQETVTKFTKLKAEITTLREQSVKLQKSAEIKMAHQKHHKLHGKYIIGGFMYTIIVVGEVLLNSSSFQLFNSLLFSVIISLAFSMGIILIGAGVANLLQNKEMGAKKRLQQIVGLLLLVAVAFYTLSILKSQYVSVRPYQMSISVSPILFWFLNAILFVATIAIKLFILPTKKEREDNQNFANAKAEVTLHTKAVETRTKELANLDTKRDAQIKKVEAEAKAKSQELTHSFQHLVNTYNNSGSAYNQVLSNLLHSESEINSFYKSALSEFVQVSNEARVDGKVMLLSEKIPPLASVFSGYKLKTEFRFDSNKDANPQRQEPSKPKQEDQEQRTKQHRSSKPRHSRRRNPNRNNNNNSNTQPKNK